MTAPDWNIHDLVATLRNVASDLKAIASELEENDGNLSSHAYNSLFRDAVLSCEYITEPSEPHL